MNEQTILRAIREARGGWTAAHIAADLGVAVWVALQAQGWVWEDAYGRVFLTAEGHVVADGAMGDGGTAGSQVTPVVAMRSRELCATRKKGAQP